MKKDMENINEEFKDGRDNRRSISHEKIKERFPNYKKPSGISKDNEAWKKLRQMTYELSERVKEIERNENSKNRGEI